MTEKDLSETKIISSQRGQQRPAVAMMRKLSAMSPLAVLVFFFAGAVSSGLPIWEGLKALAVVGFTQVLPGFLLWRLVRPMRGLLVEDIVLGFAVGMGIAVVSLLSAVTTGIAWLSLAVGPAIAVTLLATPRSRYRIFSAGTGRLPGYWYLSVSAVSLLLFRQAEEFYRLTPLSWSEGFAVAYVDMPFHLSIASQLAHRGPMEMPYVLGEPLRYHWFSHAWVAQVSEAAAIPLDVVMFRVLPPLISVVIVFTIAAVGNRIGSSPWMAPLAAFIAVAVGDLPILSLDQEMPTVVHHLSPSLALSTVVGLSLLALLVARWRSESPKWSVLMVVFLATTAVGMKASALVVIVAGVGLAALVSWLKGWSTRHVLLGDFLLLTGTLGFAMLVMFGLRTGGLTLDPLGALETQGSSGLVARTLGSEALFFVALAVIVLLVSVGAKAAGFLGLITQRGRESPSLPLLFGMAIAGISAVALLSHPGGSQWYFLGGAVPAIAVGSSMGLVALWDAVDHKHDLLRIGLGAGCAIVGTGLISTTILRESGGDLVLAAAVGSLLILTLIIAGAARAARFLLPSSGWNGAALVAVTALTFGAALPTAVSQVVRPLPQPELGVPPGSAYSFSSDQVEAARWIRENSDEDDVVATNRHCASVLSEACEARRFHVSAYTERRVLVEGWSYTPTWSRLQPAQVGMASITPFWDSELLSLNDEFFQNPSQQGASRLLDKGVSWLFVDKSTSYSSDLDQFAIPRMQTRWAWILQLSQS